VASLRRRVSVAGGSERWWFVAFGDEGVVESAFGGDGAGGVVRAGVSAFGHHHAPVASGVDFGRVVGPQGGGGSTQPREPVSAAGVGGVGVPGEALTGDTTFSRRRNTPGRSWTAGSGGWRIEESSECLQVREEMGKDDHLQAVGVPGRCGVREGD
jgi:hypothetical protein